MAEALLPPASTTRKGVDPSKFMGASFAAGSGLQKRVENNEKKITLLKNIIQQRKINVDKLLPASSDGNNKNQTIRTNNLADRLDNIAQSLGVLTRILKQQLNVDKNSAAQDLRNKKETEKRDREKGLEGKGGKLVSGVANTITKPFKGFFDSILNYFKNILLGAALLRLVKWLKNPANQAKIEAFKKFLAEDLPTAISSVIEHIKKNWKIYAALAATLVALNFVGMIAGLGLVLKALTGIGSFLLSVKGLMLLLAAIGTVSTLKLVGDSEAAAERTLKDKGIDPEKAKIPGSEENKEATQVLTKQASNPLQGGMLIPTLVEQQMKSGTDEVKGGGAGYEVKYLGDVPLWGPLFRLFGAKSSSDKDLSNNLGDQSSLIIAPKSVISKNIERPFKSNNSNKFIDLRNSQQQQQAANSTGSGDRAPSFSSTSGNDLLAVSTLSIGNA